MLLNPNFLSYCTEVSDYDVTSKTLVFTASASDQFSTVSVPITDDVFLEGDEYFFAKLAFAAPLLAFNIILDPARAMVSIEDNDGEGVGLAGVR